MLILVLIIQFNCVINIKVDLACAMSARFNCSTNDIKVICSNQKKLTQLIALSISILWLKDGSTAIYMLFINLINLYRCCCLVLFGLANRKIMSSHTLSHGCSHKTSISMQCVINLSYLSTCQASMHYL